MTQPQQAWEQRWVTQLGGYEPGKRAVLHGQDLFALREQPDWMGLLLHGITARVASDKQIRLLNALWSIGTSYPDPRLWNNRIGTLAGVAGSTGSLGIAGGLAISEALVYGQQPMIGAARMFLSLQERLVQGETLPDLIAERQLAYRNRNGSARGKLRGLVAFPGYGRPVSRRDERIAPLMRQVEALGFADRPCIRLAFELESLLLAQGFHRRYLNVGGAMAALLCDQGYSVEQQYYLWSLCFSAGIVCCAADAAGKPPGSFFPLPCHRLNYRGPAPRRWPNETDSRAHDRTSQTPMSATNQAKE